MRTKPKCRQRGAVLVEAATAIGLLLIVASCVTFVYVYTRAAIGVTQASRDKTWRSAMAGCTPMSIDPKLWLTELLDGHIPSPSGFLGETASASASASVPEPWSRERHQLQTSLRLICNAQISETNPISDPAGWVIEMFQ